MARVEADDSWIVSGNVEDQLRRVRKFLTSRKMTFTEEDDELDAAQGSRLGTRLLGGWFVPASWLPKRALVRLRNKEGGVKIHAQIEESLGFGVLDPLLKSKYERYFHDWLDALRDHTEMSSRR